MSDLEISDAGSCVYFCRLHSGGEENGVVALRGAGERSCRASGVCAQCKPAGSCEDCQLYVANVSFYCIFVFGDLTWNESPM